MSMYDLKIEVLRAFNHRQQRFVEVFGRIVLNSKTPGNGVDKILALRDLETAVNGFRQGDLNAVSEWFDSLDDNGKSLLSNVARIIWQEIYMDIKDDLEVKKNKIIDIEQMRNPLGYSYGYGYGVQEDFDYNTIFGV